MKSSKKQYPQFMELIDFIISSKQYLPLARVGGYKVIILAVLIPRLSPDALAELTVHLSEAKEVFVEFKQVKEIINSNGQGNLVKLPYFKTILGAIAKVRQTTNGKDSIAIKVSGLKPEGTTPITLVLKNFSNEKTSAIIEEYFQILDLFAKEDSL